MKKLLIISSHFPPLNTMAAKRYGYMCKYMKKNGYDPYIITTRSRGGGYLNSKLDLEVPISEEKIIRIGDLGINYPCLESEINEVLYKYSTDGVSSRIIEEQSLGWYYKVKKELNINKLKDIDVVLGTFPSIGNVLVARYIAEKLDKPFVVEIRDLISDYNEGYNKNESYQKIELQLENKLLKDASGIVAVTSGFKNVLQERYPSHKMVTVYNGWDNQNKLYEKNIRKDYLYYAGSLYEHRMKSIELLIDTIKEYNLDVNLIIRSIGPEKLEDVLKEYICVNAMQNKVKVLKAASESVVRREQSEAKVNVLFSSLDFNDKSLMTTLPGKLFEMIRLDNPVLAIADKTAEIGEILNKTKKGRIVDDKKEILNFLVDDMTEYEGYHKEVEYYSRENQTKILCEFLDEISKGECVMNKLVSNGLSFAIGTITGLTTSNIKLNKIIEKKQTEKEKFKIMYQMMEKWLRLKLEGKNIEDYFKAYGYKHIAIYGMGDVGKNLLNELNNSSIVIDYAIDKAVDSIENLKVINPEDELEKVDAIVVTAIAYFDDINEEMSLKVKCPIISLEDIIYELV